MALTTTDSLVSDALFRAGEPTGGTSDFQTQVVQYLNDLQNLLVFGGTLGARDLATSAGLYAQVVDVPVMDWPFLRKNPRGVFNTISAIQSLSSGSPAGTVTLTQESATITFSVTPHDAFSLVALSVAGWRLQVTQAASGVPAVPATVPRILSHTAGSTTATLDVPWPQPSQTVSVWQAFQLEYNLAADFVRFTGTPVVHATGFGYQPLMLNMSIGQTPMEDIYPLPVIEQGAPSAAALIATQTIQLNRWDTLSYRIEYPYIFQPPTLITGVNQVPVLPPQYLLLLSIGAAMLVAQDKSDSRAERLSSEFREIMVRMQGEFRKHLAAASEHYGRFLFRQPRQAEGRLVRTNSGQIIY